MLWMHDRAVQITWGEYKFWMNNKLPTGWMILSAPAPKAGERP